MLKVPHFVIIKITTSHIKAITGGLFCRGFNNTYFFIC